MGYWIVENISDVPQMESISISCVHPKHFILRYRYKLGMPGDYVSKSLRGAKMIASREFKKDKKLIFKKID